MTKKYALFYVDESDTGEKYTEKFKNYRATIEIDEEVEKKWLQVLSNIASWRRDNLLDTCLFRNYANPRFLKMDLSNNTLLSYDSRFIYGSKYYDFGYDIRRALSHVMLICKTISKVSNSAGNAMRTSVI